MRIGDVISDVFSSDLVDILVNNAGSSPIAPSSLETNEQLFDRVLSLNFKGPFRLSALVGSRMAAGDGGSVINVSSAGALRPRPQIAPYAGANAAPPAVPPASAVDYVPPRPVHPNSPARFLPTLPRTGPHNEQSATS